MASRRELILQDRLAALKLINGQEPYLTEPKLVSREFKPVESLNATEFPALFLTGAPERKNRTSNHDMNSFFRIEIRGYVRRDAGPATGGKTLSASLNDLLHDVERALFVDETCGAEAMSTIPLDVEVDEISLDEIAGFLAPFDIQYTYPVGQP